MRFVVTVGTVVLVAAACGSASHDARVTPPKDVSGPPGSGVSASAVDSQQPVVLAGTCYQLGAERNEPPPVPTTQPTPKPTPPSSRTPSPSPSARLRVRRSGRYRYRRPSSGRGSVNLDKVTFVGKYDRWTLRNRVNSRRWRIQSCYRTRLREKPGIGGNVTALFTIDSTGSVSRASFAAFDAAAGNCVRDQLLQIKFARVTEAVRARVSFRFRPNWKFTKPAGQRDDRDVLGAPSVDPAHARCAGRTRLRLSANTRSELLKCYQQAGWSRLRLTAVVDVDSAGSVTTAELRGMRDGELAACVARSMRGARFAAGHARRMACSLGFDTPAASRSIDNVVRMDVSRGDITVGKFKVGESMDLTAPVPGAVPSTAEMRSMLLLRRYEQWYRSSRGWPVGGRDRLAIHAHPGVPATVLSKVMGVVRPIRFSPIYFTRAVGTSDMWNAVNPLGTPNWLCTGARAPLRLRVTGSSFKLFQGSKSLAVVPQSDRTAPAKLRKVLRSYRDRLGPDIDVAVGANARYRDMLNALEAAVAVGFFDARIVE